MGVCNLAIPNISRMPFFILIDHMTVGRVQVGIDDEEKAHARSGRTTGQLGCAPAEVARPSTTTSASLERIRGIESEPKPHRPRALKRNPRERR